MVEKGPERGRKRVKLGRTAGTARAQRARLQRIGSESSEKDSERADGYTGPVRGRPDLGIGASHVKRGKLFISNSG